MDKIEIKFTNFDRSQQVCLKLGFFLFISHLPIFCMNSQNRKKPYFRKPIFDLGGQIPKLSRAYVQIWAYSILLTVFYPILIIKTYTNVFRRLGAKRKAPQSMVLSMLRLFDKIGPKFDQIWAWLSRGHRWAPGVRNPLKSSVTGPSLLVNATAISKKFHKKSRWPPPPPTPTP